MQERSQYQEGLYFLLLWGRFSDINQDGYTTLHDTSSLVRIESLVNPKLFWRTFCWCARPCYLFMLWVLNSEPFYLVLWQLWLGASLESELSSAGAGPSRVFHMVLKSTTSATEPAPIAIILALTYFLLFENWNLFPKIYYIKWSNLIKIF